MSTENLLGPAASLAADRLPYTPAWVYLLRCADGSLYAGWTNDLARRLLFGDGGPADEYLLLADFESYRDAHVRAGQVYLDPTRWNQMSLVNIARSGIFAADRSIRDYAREIWDIPVRA